MKKLQYRAFGGPEVLELAEVDVPAPGAGEVLVRVKAAAINPIDWKLREGQVKFLSGWRMPQGQGYEFAGVVERLGRGVTAYAVGDEVFGAGKDCVAELCVAKVGRMAKKPTGVSFAVASAIACVGTTAASAFDRPAVKPDARVLVNGATGGIGMFAAQMAIARGANVTAVVGDKGVEAAQRWGPARVVNYRTTNILEEGIEYDVVFELSDKLPFSRAKPIMNQGGTFFASLPNPAEFIPGFLQNPVSSRKYALMGMRAERDVLQTLASEVASGKIEVVIGKTFGLASYHEAYTDAAAGKIIGKTVFIVEA